MIKYAYVLITLLALTNSVKFLTNNEAVKKKTLPAVEFKFSTEETKDIKISLKKPVVELKITVSCEMKVSHMSSDNVRCNVEVKTESGRSIEPKDFTISISNKYTISYDYVINGDTNYTIDATMIDFYGKTYSRKGFFKKFNPTI